VFLQPEFNLVSTDTLPGPVFNESSTRSFATLTFVSKNTRVLNGYYFEGNVEYGSIAQDVVFGERTTGVNSEGDSVSFFSRQGNRRESNDFLKLSGLYKYNFDIGIKDKPLEFRVFASYLVKRSNNAIYNNNIGSSDRAGYYDYKFDDYLLHRNAQYGLFQNQIDNNTSASKFVGNLGSPDRWLISGNVTMPLPGKIPLKPYVEFLMFDDLDVASWNKSGSKLMFNVGIEVEIVKDRFEIFLNLAQSSDVTDYQENGTIGIDNFGERITFVLDLNGLRPNKLKKQLKLF
jgi:hypothetical protein